MAKVIWNLPDFIIIGANKAGTTSVANYLNSHPDIQMSKVKEPMFFSTEPTQSSAAMKEASLARPYFTLTLNEYSEMFDAANGKVVKLGEASTSYLANPNTSSKLMRKIVPDVKIIVILRDPVERAISAYKMCVGNGIESRKFSEIVLGAEQDLKILDAHGVKEYIRNGLYVQLLQPYFNFFSKDQILITAYEELRETPSKLLSKIFGFVGVDDHEVSTKKKFNTAADNLKRGRIEIKQEDIDRLRTLFRPELERLLPKMDFDISHWIAE